MNGRGTEALPALFQDKAADIPCIVLGPHHEHISDRAVGDPHLAAGQTVAAVDLPGTGDHRARVGAVVGLGQTKTTDPLATGQLGKYFCFWASVPNSLMGTITSDDCTLIIER